jgi:hypothetical protein
LKKVNQLVTTFFLKIHILCKRFNSPKTPHCIVVPNSIIPCVLALYNYKTHAGAKKLLAAIKLKYYQKNMEADVISFCKGCILCSINKSSLLGKSELGTSRLLSEPLSSWQIDVCSGLTSVNGVKAFLIRIDR